MIAGYTAPGGSRHGFGAIVLGVYESRGKLVYAGKVGTGFDDELLSELSKKIREAESGANPRSRIRRAKRASPGCGRSWWREVEFTERTNEGLIRQGSFMGLREDIPAKTVGIEKPQSPRMDASIKDQHPERLIWPASKISKIELARYYDEIGDWMLPHVANRRSRWCAARTARRRSASTSATSAWARARATCRR